MTSLTHVSKQPIEALRPFTAQRYRDDGRERPMKPLGFWYSIDSGWEDWCLSEQPHWLTNHYQYDVVIDPACHILQLDTIPALRDFVARYGTEAYPGARGLEYPDWARVATDYDGVACAPYYHGALRFELGFLWYYGWDCDSGCLWRPKQTTLALRQQFAGSVAPPEYSADDEPRARGED